jgi:hypothetical protein
MKMRLLFLSVLLLPAVIGSGEGGSGDNNDSVVSESLLSTQPPPPLQEATGVERKEGQSEMRSNFTQKQLESNSDNDGGQQPSFTGLLNG